MKIVPFFANTKDDLHCYQASLRMILKFFLPEKNFTFKKLDELTGQKKGMWTWPMRGVLGMQQIGFKFVDIEEFDYQRVAQDAKKYLVEVYGEETAEKQIKHSDIFSVERDAQEFCEKIKIDYRLPTFKDIQDLLDKGYLITCLVNSKTLSKKKGYVGHCVVVFKCDSRNVFLHDPGLPPLKNRKVSRMLFEKAWGYPNEKAKNILAFRYIKVARKD